MYEYEQEAYAQGFRAVCGVDEAGRGPLAGDVYAAAVILPQGLEIPGIDDSKKLSAKKREQLYGDRRGDRPAEHPASIHAGNAPGGCGAFHMS